MSETDEFHRLAAQIVEDGLQRDPVGATWMGDHRFDGQLPDQAASAHRDDVLRIDDHLTALDAIDDIELELDDFVDLEILRARLLQARFDLDELRSCEWNPLAWNPGTALHLLVSRDFAAADDRSRSLLERVVAIPDFLADGRHRLGDMPKVHVETAVAQMAGTVALIDGPVRELARADAACDKAIEAVRDFSTWLAEQSATRDPRLGERLYSAALWHGLDDDISAEEVLADAESHLARVHERMQEAAAQFLGIASASMDDVRSALDAIAQRHPVTDATVLPLVEEALATATEFVRTHDLVTIPEMEIAVIEMPEIHRGVAVAYCDAPGPLETAKVPTFVAVSPTPADWSADRVASFYREYNGALLPGLTIHEAMPGHVLQLAHGRAGSKVSLTRKVGMSGVFVEGWAVYAEELMLDRGFALEREDPHGLALRLQQLKMQARMAINAILDVRVHTHAIDETEAMALMTQQGFQEEGEAVGKWRRALLTHAQLPTYFVGYRAVSSIAHDLRVMHPQWSDAQVHDLMLGHGSPAPRHLRTLLGL